MAMNSIDDELIVFINTFRIHEKSYRSNYLNEGYECLVLNDSVSNWKGTTGYQPFSLANMADWRAEMCEWSYSIVDHCCIGREVVFISFSFIDRLLSKFRCSKTQYKLVAMTSVYLAIKLNSKKKVKAKSFADLSCDCFSSSDIESMEMIILSALSWKVHPPMPCTFASYMIKLLTQNVSLDLDFIRDISIYLIELSAYDYFFVPIDSSSIAIASVLSAIDIHSSSVNLDVTLIKSEFILTLLQQRFVKPLEVTLIKVITSRLKKMYTC